MQEKFTQAGVEAGLLFLREDELRLVQEMLFFAQLDRNCTSPPTELTVLV